MSSSKIILIAGPTASGKSALAMELARKTGGTIINADAMQIYKGLPVLSAQPDAKAQKEIPRELYGVFDPAEPSSAGKWLKLATATIDKTIATGRTPILVGGNGLYFKAQLGGLAHIPPIPAAVRDTTQKLYRELGEEKFRGALAKIDPDSAKRIARNDRQRLIRAYEVAAHTGKSLSHWHKQPSPASHTLGTLSRNAGEGGDPTRSVGEGEGLVIEPHLLMPIREELYMACDKRFEKMIENGAVEEAKKFLQRKLDPELPSMKTLGLREIAAYLRGEIKRDEAITKAQQATRNYAKRQMTWFRNQWKTI